MQVGGQLPGGLWLRGLSGGERKRLSLAAGLLGSPGMLFLDEPTSGLDSSAALSVVSHLQQLAAMQQKLVLVCVHQPRAAIWSLFDQVGGCSWVLGSPGAVSEVHVMVKTVLDAQLWA
jgi:ABC-type Mn2+/Zn2+ transport system ATPase subunit